MKKLVVAIHGIMTGQTDPSWTDRLDAWMYCAAPDWRVLKKEYAAGPFPRLNCLVKNRRLARGLVNEIRLLLESHETASGDRPAVWFVAHSNGALIALAAVRTLIAEGRDVAGLILIGAACAGDIRKNGVLDWVVSGRLGKALAYCSLEDGALPGRAVGCSEIFPAVYRALVWPYGSLGRDGWTLDGGRVPRYLDEVLIGERIVSRWFGGGHSGYFAPERIEYTFRQIKEEMQRQMANGQRVSLQVATQAQF